MRSSTCCTASISTSTPACPASIRMLPPLRPGQGPGPPSPHFFCLHRENVHFFLRTLPPGVSSSDAAALDADPSLACDIISSAIPFAAADDTTCLQFLNCTPPPFLIKRLAPLNTPQEPQRIPRRPRQPGPGWCGPRRRPDGGLRYGFEHAARRCDVEGCPRHPQRKGWESPL